MLWLAVLVDLTHALAPADLRAEAVVVVAPLRLAGGSGAPARVLADVPR